MRREGAAGCADSSSGAGWSRHSSVAGRLTASTCGHEGNDCPVSLAMSKCIAWGADTGRGWDEPIASSRRGRPSVPHQGHANSEVPAAVRPADVGTGSVSRSRRSRRGGEGKAWVQHDYL